MSKKRIAANKASPDELANIPPVTATAFPLITEFNAEFSGSKTFARACIVTNELAELHQNGGIGTACSGLIQTLLSHAIDVHVLYTMAIDIQAEAVTYAVAALERLGVSVTFLQTLVPAYWMQDPRRISYGCFEFLRTAEQDIILFNDYLGNGFYAGQAKRVGIAFRGVPIVTTIHGPTRWAHQIDERPIASLDQEEICLLEAKAVEYSDVVIGVSNYILQWLQTNGVKLPPLTFVHKNTLPNMGIRKGRGELPAQELREVVFFARQDVRKGIHVFIGAVKLLAKLHPYLKFTFLGKFSRIAGEHSGALVLDELRTVSNIIDFRHNYDREQALNYLQREGVLAVIPSLDENSPCTVFECIEAGIPFIASDVGGIPELIEKESHKRVLFKPGAVNLAERIRQIIGEGIQTPRLAFDIEESAKQRFAFFKKVIDSVSAADHDRAAALAAARPLVSICITHYNRSKLLDNLLKELEKQTYDHIEIIVIDDGSTNAEDVKYFESVYKHKFPIKTQRIPNSYLGAARNAAVRLAAGEYVKFQDDDNIPLPNEIATFVDAANWSGSDVLTCFAYMFKSETDLPKPKTYLDIEYLPLGASLPLSLFRNEYGDANALVRREVFDKLGGFTELRGIGAEDYEFFGRAEVAGYQVRVIPQPLFNYRISDASMLQTTSIYANAKRARRAFGSRAAAWVDQIMDFAQNVHLSNEIRVTAWHRAGKRRFGELHQQLLEGEPNDSLCLNRFIDLASRYERLEDILHLVMRSNPISEALGWLERSAEAFRKTTSRKRSFLVGRPQVIDLSELRDVELIGPLTDLPEDFELTKIASNGVLVHPLTRRETSVLLARIIPRGTKRITLVCFHAGELGRPLKMAFEVVKLGQQFGRSEWMEIVPNGQVEITLDLIDSLKAPSDLLIKSTIEEIQYYAWAYAKRLIIEGDFDK
jgi:glycosyltransferase involved in cell wall biosynthesis